jgi:hypothetical protein
MILVTIVHIVLAIVLFFGVNLLGQYSPSNLGYYQLTTFLETEEAPGFNFSIRVLTPTVFTILISAFFYSVGLDNYIFNIYLTTVYYVIFRTIFNIVIGRSKLINWPVYIFYSVSIILLGFFAYKKIILTKSNILPDFNNVANELWIIIMVFLYNFVNNISISDSGVQRRKDKYIRAKLSIILKEYYTIVKEVAGDNLRLRQIALAIILYEDFNRPKLFRLVEYIGHYISGKPYTLGIMQVRTSKVIGDKESVRFGTQKLLDDYMTLKKEYDLELEAEKNISGSYDYLDNRYQRRLVEKFNPDISYSEEVLEIADEINKQHFDNKSLKLFN